MVDLLLLSPSIWINLLAASAAIAVDSNHMTASSSALWRRFRPPSKSNFVNGHVSTMWFMVCLWPQSQEGDWARSHLCKCMSDHIGHRILGVEMQAVDMDAQRHQDTQANLDELQWFEAYCPLPLYDVQKEVQHCWSLVAMRAVCVAGSLKSDTLHYEVGRWWDLCNWILDSSILRLSCIELRLTCSGCLRWHPIKYQRVSQSGCSCSLASLHYMTGVPCMRVRSKFTPRYTGQGSCFRRWPFMWTFSSWSDLLLCRWKTLVKVLDMLGFRRHSWQYLVIWARSAVTECILSQRKLLFADIQPQPSKFIKISQNEMKQYCITIPWRWLRWCCWSLISMHSRCVYFTENCTIL